MFLTLYLCTITISTLLKFCYLIGIFITKLGCQQHDGGKNDQLRRCAFSLLLILQCDGLTGDTVVTILCFKRVLGSTNNHLQWEKFHQWYKSQKLLALL